MVLSRTHHISQQFDKELEEIRSKVLSMGGLVEELLSHVLDAMSKNDLELAEQIAASDYRVNDMEVDIDGECTAILLRRQPAAGDLRLVLAISKIIGDLERVGDEVKKVARIVSNFSNTGSQRSYYVGVLAMGYHVRRMLRAALDAFARMDSHAALEVAQEDLEVDKELEAVMRQLITYMMEDPRNIRGVLDAVLAARAFERIGDHADNICENAIFLVEGKDVRHVALEDVRQQLEQGRGT
ncbi:MAG: phosphate signaling complex protein PhoU [Gammaproteobacteria bacterium]|nr:phosphate signaling complex protein PhoU [Gammaproteobacteria bacterium]